MNKDDNANDDAYNQIVLQIDKGNRPHRKEFIEWFSENCDGDIRRKLLAATLTAQLNGFLYPNSSFHEVHKDIFVNTRPRKERVCFWETCQEYVRYLVETGHYWRNLETWVKSGMDEPSQRGTLRHALAHGLWEDDPLAEAVFADMADNMSLVLGKKKAQCSGPALSLLNAYADYINWYIPQKP